jgi:hypothetical protein
MKTWVAIDERVCGIQMHLQKEGILNAKAVLMWMVEVGKFVIGRTATYSHSLTLMEQLYDSINI